MKDLQKIIKMKQEAFKVLFETKKRLEGVVIDAVKLRDYNHERISELQSENTELGSLINSSSSSISEINKITGEV